MSCVIRLPRRICNAAADNIHIPSTSDTDFFTTLVGVAELILLILGYLVPLTVVICATLLETYIWGIPIRFKTITLNRKSNTRGNHSKNVARYAPEIGISLVYLDIMQLSITLTSYARRNLGAANSVVRFLNPACMLAARYAAIWTSFVFSTLLLDHQARTKLFTGVDDEAGHE
jgi:hypothetical protein